MKTSRKTKIIAILNQKGGVGKSTLAFHIAHAAAKAGKKPNVLCIDLDSQANLSQFLTGDLKISKRVGTGVGQLLEGEPMELMATSSPAIVLLHGHEQLDRYDHDNDANDRASAPTMREFLLSLGFDYIVVDTPPAVGLRHVAPLLWADIAIIPTEPGMTSVNGMQRVMELIAKEIWPRNPDLKAFTVANKINVRAGSHVRGAEWLKETYGDQVLGALASRISVGDGMEEAPAKPVWSRVGAPKALRDEWLSLCNLVLSK